MSLFPQFNANARAICAISAPRQDFAMEEVASGLVADFPGLLSEADLHSLRRSVSGMVVARALNNVEFSDRLRAATTKAALEIGGWIRPKKKRVSRG